MREIRTLGAMWPKPTGFPSQPQFKGTGSNKLGLTFGIPRQSSTLPYKKGESESILAPSLAASIARCWSKRRQGYRWAGRLSFEKRVNQDADLLT